MALNPEIKEIAKQSFEKRCFKLIIEAYRDSLIEKVIQLDWNENDISSELHRHIKGNLLRLKWKVSTNVEADIPKDFLKVKGFADKFPRIDFRLTSFMSNYEYEYFFEAKNLKQNDSALKRRYINTGIDNFVTQKYENVSLIGYLLEGKIDETVNGINALLKMRRRHAEFLALKPNKLFRPYYESNHSGIGVLKHLIFDFTPSSPHL